MTKPAILIAGPTASGKSAVALKLAQALGGVVINADSMQVYSDLRVLTVRPTAEQEARAPHRLYGVMGAEQNCSVGRWLGLVEAALAESRRQNWPPIFVGGTGLYFKALTDGLVRVPDIPNGVRQQARQLFTELGAARFRQNLAQRDPEAAARLPSSDRQRLIRAWEVVAATGTPLKDWQQTEANPPLVSHPVQIVLQPDRAWLYGRCDARFDRMIAQGAIDEVRSLMARRLAPDLPAMKALGVPLLIAALEGRCTMDEAISAAKTATRHYAKRQMTWFRNQMISWKRVSEQDSERIAEEIFSIIRENALTTD